MPAAVVGSIFFCYLLEQLPSLRICVFLFSIAIVAHQKFWHCDRSQFGYRMVIVSAIARYILQSFGARVLWAQLSELFCPGRLQGFACVRCLSDVFLVCKSVISILLCRIPLLCSYVQGGDFSRSAAIDFCHQAVGGRRNSVRLQHLAGVYPSPCLALAWEVCRSLSRR